MYVYCLFCETSRCARVAQIAELIQPCRAISPITVQHILKKGKVLDIERSFLPGYVFVYYDEQPGPQLFKLRRIPGVYDLIGDRDNDYCLAGRDESFALRILQTNGVIGGMAVYEENQVLHLVSSDLDELDVMILKVDRRKHRMKIQLTFANNQVSTWVEYMVHGSQKC